MAETTEEFDRRMDQLANDIQLKIEKELYKELMTNLPCTLCGNNCQVSPIEQFNEERAQMIKEGDTND